MTNIINKINTSSEIIKKHILDKKTRLFYLIPILTLAFGAYFVGALSFQVTQDVVPLDFMALTATILGITSSLAILLILVIQKIFLNKISNLYLFILSMIVIILAIVGIVAIVLGTISYMEHY